MVHFKWTLSLSLSLSLSVSLSLSLCSPTTYTLGITPGFWTPKSDAYYRVAKTHRMP